MFEYNTANNIRKTIAAHYLRWSIF